MEKQIQTKPKSKIDISPIYNIPVSEKYFLVGRKLSKEEVEKLGLPWTKAYSKEVWIEIPKKIIDEKQK